MANRNPASPLFSIVIKGRKFERLKYLEDVIAHPNHEQENRCKIVMAGANTLSTNCGETYLYQLKK